RFPLYLCHSVIPMKNSIELKLRERVKELKCLYELSHITWDEDTDIQVVLRKTLHILPAAMQHTTVAEARILFDDKEYATKNIKKTKYRIQSPLVIDNRKRGLVEVAYVASRSINATKPFLKEEKTLLDTVSKELSFIIQRILMQEEKQKLQQKLQHVERLAFVGELSAGIAHELNEPLGRILGFEIGRA